MRIFRPRLRRRDPENFNRFFRNRGQYGATFETRGKRRDFSDQGGDGANPKFLKVFLDRGGDAAVYKSRLRRRDQKAILHDLCVIGRGGANSLLHELAVAKQVDC